MPGTRRVIAVLRGFGSRYSERACEIFLLREWLRNCYMRGGMFGELVKVSWHLARRNGREDARIILAALFYRVPLFRASLRA